MARLADKDELDSVGFALRGRRVIRNAGLQRTCYFQQHLANKIVLLLDLPIMGSGSTGRQSASGRAALYTAYAFSLGIPDQCVGQKKC